MKDRVANLTTDVRERLTTLLVQGGHLSHPLRLQAHVETDATKDDLVARLAETLPAYMIPEQIITSAALPRLPNGKLDRSALQNQQPAEVNSMRQDAKPVVETSEVLETLRQIWAQVLGTDQIYDEDNFFEMGGDSLLSISVVSRARKAGLNLVPSDLFDYPSLSELAERIGADGPSEMLNEVGSGPLSMSNRGDDENAQPIFLLNANRKMLDSLNAQLKPSRTLHLLTLHWDSGNVDGLDSIEAIADDFLRSIREIQPDGPYSIGGFSIGAVAAYEIARCLRVEDVTVSDLILIDPPENPELFASPHNTEHEFQVPKSEAMTLARKVRINGTMVLARVCRALKVPLSGRLKSSYAAATYFKAAKRYHIRKPAVPVIIVRRSSQSQTSMWARAEDLFDLHEVSCSHEEFHRDPTMIKTWTGLLAKSLGSNLR